MSIQCGCDFDSDAPEFYNESRPRARKEYKCCECGGAIRVGESHKKITGKWDSVETFRTCADCSVIWCDFGKAAKNCGCMVIGYMASTIRNAYRNSPREEADAILLPIICAFNAASKQRGGIQIKTEL